MNVVIVTRCGCRKSLIIETAEPPPGIVLNLDLPTGLKGTRRFSYMGRHKIHDVPMYLEDIEQKPMESDEDRELIKDDED